MIGEWYGSSGPNVGLKMSARDVAAGIVEREAVMRANGLISQAVKPGPADNQIDNVTESGTPTIASEMRAKGIRWTSSDKASGTRKIGLELMRQRIREAAKPAPESPGLWFMDHCRTALAQIPVLPRDEKNSEDVCTKSEDHLYDAIRYRCLAAKREFSSTPLRM